MQQALTVIIERIHHSPDHLPLTGDDAEDAALSLDPQVTLRKDKVVALSCQVLPRLSHAGKNLGTRRERTDRFSVQRDLVKILSLFRISEARKKQEKQEKGDRNATQKPQSFYLRPFSFMQKQSPPLLRECTVDRK